MSVAIRFEQVACRFPGTPRPAVDGCSFTVEGGRLVVLLGRSGCGKTTLLKMVNRLVEPTAGTVFLDGVDVRSMDVTALRRRIGYVIQQVGLFPHMSVAQNVAVVPRLLGWPRERIAARVDELLALVHLPPEEFRARRPSQLSGGQQQRVGLARALAGDPEVLLMDEPFGALDTITRASLQDELLHLQRTLHKTVLFVTHDVDEALRLADCIAVMQEGRIVQYDTPLTVLLHPASEAVRALLGADDRFLHLSLLSVGAAMRPPPSDYARGGEPTVAPTDHLRHALGLLLTSHAPFLSVVDGERVAGIVTLDDVRRVAQQAAGPP